MLKFFNNINDVNYQKNDVFMHFTGNVFGIGCSAFSKEGIKKISELKKRDASKGFVVLFSSFEQAEKFSLPQLKDKKISTLLNQYLPGNVTFILKTENDRFEDIWIDSKIAFRIPNSKLLRDFIDKIETPVLSTSINISGQDLCNDFDEIKSTYSDWFDYGIYDQNEIKFASKPSTLIDFKYSNEEKTTQLICLREGAIPFNEIKESWTHPTIQFVCVGNICRSPMAELYAQKRFAEENLTFKAESSGLMDAINQISSHSKTMLEMNGIPVEQKFSRQINENILSKSAIVVCMSKQIKHHLLQRFPNAVNKVFTFAEFTDNEKDIDDPYGLEIDAYKKAWNLIKNYTDKLVIKLKG